MILAYSNRTTVSASESKLLPYHSILTYQIAGTETTFVKHCEPQSAVLIVSTIMFLRFPSKFRSPKINTIQY